MNAIGFLHAKQYAPSQSDNGYGTVTNANTDESDQTAESGQSHRSSDGSDIMTTKTPQNEIIAHTNARFTRGLREHHSRNTNLMLLLVVAE